ncbi:MAG: hypothetical protein R8M46_01785 [Ghiorsea sp.]
MSLNNITFKGLVISFVWLMMSTQATAFSEPLVQQDLDTSDARALQVVLKEISDDMRAVTNTWVGGKANELTCDDFLLLHDRVVSQKVRLYGLEDNIRILRIKYGKLAADEATFMRTDDESEVVMVGPVQKTYAAIQTWETRARSSIKLNGFVSGALKRCQTQRMIREQDDLQGTSEETMGAQ